jgi:RNA polymerase sigma-70 factor (ECF subfamily)
MIDAIKQGDTLAFEQAYILYRERVYFYFKKKTRSEEDTKDLLQTTFLKLWKYRLSLCNDYLLEQQLFHIARTVYIDHLRKQNKVIKTRNIAEAENENASYIYTTATFDVNSRLQTALSAMPKLQKKVFELNRIQGYSYREVAELLSISVKAVDNNLTKALKQLRKIFALFLWFLL